MINWRASETPSRGTLDDPARQGRLNCQRLKQGKSVGAPRSHFLRLLESSFGQHHARVRARACRYHIRVNGVNPTVVMTPVSAWYWGREDIEGPFLEAMPLGRWATAATRGVDIEDNPGSFRRG